MQPPCDLLGKSEIKKRDSDAGQTRHLLLLGEGRGGNGNANNVILNSPKQIDIAGKSIMATIMFAEALVKIIMAAFLADIIVNNINYSIGTLLFTSHFSKTPVTVYFQYPTLQTLF